MADLHSIRVVLTEFARTGAAADSKPGNDLYQRTVAAALLLLLPPARPGWHSVPDREPIDGEWNAGSDRISLDDVVAGRVRINDTVFRSTWSASVAEVREYAAALLSAAARAEEAANSD